MNSSDKEKLKDLEKELQLQVFGQDNAIHALVQAIKRSLERACDRVTNQLVLSYSLALQELGKLSWPSNWHRLQEFISNAST